MQFLKLTGLTIEDQLNDKESQTTLLGDIYLLNNHASLNIQEEVFFFLNEISDFGIVTFGVVAPDSINAKQYVNGFLKKINLKLVDIKLEDITSSAMFRMIKTAVDSKYIPPNEELFKQIGLTKAEQFIKLPCHKDAVIKKTCKEDIYKKSATLPLKNTLIPELDRIYAKPSNNKNIGHPVHYMVQENNIDIQNQTCELLIQALHVNNRVFHKRFSTVSLNISPINIDSEDLENIYSSNIGGTVVLQFKKESSKDDFDPFEYFDDEENPFERRKRTIARDRRIIIETICEKIRKYRNKVLTILCFPREYILIKNSIIKELDKISFMEIREKFINKKAKEYLTSLAKNNNITADNMLFDKIQPNKEYLQNALDCVFDEWYDNNLKTKIFPQYSEFASSKVQTNQASKGKAYNELSELIGLNDAKQLILEAINHCNAQKIFANKGMQASRPSMHMIFSGNPGTAKTTVARLFAQIMRDESLLSKGHLVECGRADLIARYVGATAIKVQEKFQEAKGGVLFIDEAYSLVDDRDGLFGDEAISTIVQEMENNRDDTVVIFAGYTDKMEKFLEKNQGLRSRITHHINFADYNTDELIEIANLIAKEKDIILSKEALDKLKDIFDKIIEEPSFGNGRYVRNILEQAEIAKSSRLLKNDTDSLTEEYVKTILAEDIKMLAVSQKEEQRKIKVIGF